MIVMPFSKLKASYYFSGFKKVCKYYCSLFVHLHTVHMGEKKPAFKSEFSESTRPDTFKYLLIC